MWSCTACTLYNEDKSRKCNACGASCPSSAPIVVPDVPIATNTQRHSIEICLKTVGGQTITLQCYADNTIEHLTRQIQDKEGIPAVLQRLFFAGRPLESARQLSDYNIQRGSTLHLLLWRRDNYPSTENYQGIIPRPPFPAGFSDLSDNSDDDYVPIATNTQRHSIEIYAKTLGGRTIPLQCYADNTIEHLKRQIQDKEGIPAASQRLLFAGRQLDSARQLSHYNIQRGSTLHLLLQLQWIYVKTLAGRTFTLQCYADNTIQDLKWQIQDKHGIPAAEQRLVFEDRQLDSARRLSDYNIHTHSTLHLILQCQLKLVRCTEPASPRLTLKDDDAPQSGGSSRSVNSPSSKRKRVSPADDREDGIPTPALAFRKGSEQEIKALKQELASLRSMTREKEEQVQTYRAERRAAAQAHRQELQEQQAAHGQEVEKYQANLRSLNQENQEYQGQLRSATQAHQQALKDKAAALKSAEDMHHLELEDARQSASREKEQAFKALSHAQNQVKVLQKELRQERAKRQREGQATQSLEAKILRYQVQLDARHKSEQAAAKRHQAELELAREQAALEVKRAARTQENLKKKFQHKLKAVEKILFSRERELALQRVQQEEERQAAWDAMKAEQAALQQESEKEKAALERELEKERAAHCEAENAAAKMHQAELEKARQNASQEAERAAVQAQKQLKALTDAKEELKQERAGRQREQQEEARAALSAQATNRQSLETKIKQQEAQLEAHRAAEKAAAKQHRAELEMARERAAVEVKKVVADAERKAQSAQEQAARNQEQLKKKFQDELKAFRGMVFGNKNKQRKVHKISQDDIEREYLRIGQMLDGSSSHCMYK